MKHIRPAAVAGAFYPARAEILSQDIADMLATAQRYIAAQAMLPKALIVPHAGYVYSGPIAASAYACLRGGQYRRVVLVGPSHRIAVRGLALPGSDGFATPLGVVPVDREAMAAVARLPQVVESDQAHAQEHSLEVQLPFLQKVLGDFSVVPLAVGEATPDEVAEVLECLWGGPETLIVISSDLSHYLPYDMAKKVDDATAQAILELRDLVSHDQACGGAPVNGFLLAARRHRLIPELLDLRNSGDTGGDRGRVVGYAAFAFAEKIDYDH